MEAAQTLCGKRFGVLSLPVCARLGSVFTLPLELCLNLQLVLGMMLPRYVEMEYISFQVNIQTICDLSLTFDQILR